MAVSNGADCTSATYEPSHVPVAMALDDDVVHGPFRMSWSHATPPAPRDRVASRLAAMM